MWETIGTNLHMNQHIVKCVCVPISVLYLSIYFELCQVRDFHGGHLKNQDGGQIPRR